MINIVDEHKPRKFSFFTTDKGVVLCDGENGAFLVLRFTEELKSLKELLDKIEVTEQ